MKRLPLLLLLLYFYFPVFGQMDSFSELKLNSYQKSDKVWQLMSKMTIDEKIGQLIMAPAISITDSSHLRHIDSMVRLYHVGGILFFQGSPVSEVTLTNYGQKLSKIPFFVAMDAEWGVGMRLDSVILFPKQMTLGAIKNDSLIYRMGLEIARQCKILGININFAPVVDINNNPSNPVIHMRSFGEEKNMVTNKALMYMNGLRDGGTMAVAKHFPGHGDTKTDSHKDLPMLPFSRQRIDSLELYPYKKFIENGIRGIMVAHLNIPSLDSTANLPSSLSSKIVKDLLIDSLCFEGLVFTDALNMRGVLKNFNPGEIEVKALLAGNDILVYPGNVSVAFNAIRQAVDSGIIPMALIDYKVERILREKLKFYPDSFSEISTSGLTNNLNTGEARWLKRELIENSLTLVRNNNNIIPFKNLDQKSFAAVALGVNYEPPFHGSLNLYAKTDAYFRLMYDPKKDYDTLLNRLRKYNTVIVSLHNLYNNNTETFGISKQAISFVDSLRKITRVVLVNFGTPYALRFFDSCSNILQAYEVHLDFQELAAEALFGGIPIKGVLPVSVNEVFCYRDGIPQTNICRLKYTIPEEFNIPARRFNPIDSLAEKAIRNKATPGCQVLIAKEGKVIYYKSFGYHLYDSVRQVKNTDIYDLASVSKITATLPVIMKLIESGKLRLTDTLGKFIPETSAAGKGNISIRELLLHEAGLQAWIPFYLYTIDHKHHWLPGYYSDTFSNKFPIKVADSIFAVKSIVDSVWKQILHSPVKNPGKYVYSDLSFIFLKRVAETFYKTPFEQIVKTDYFSKLGMSLTCYNPYKYFRIDQVVPTEQDTYWRMQLVHGYVHDMAAAMMGGVSGHAGLFSDCNDLAKLFQMYLNKGVYGGDTFFKAATIGEFTTRQSSASRRGYGFDKQETDTLKGSPTCKSASHRHTDTPGLQAFQFGLTLKKS